MLESELLKAKFHYASWFGADSKPNSITLSGSNQLRTSFEPDSVMEFGREPASSCYFAASKLDDIPNFSSNQLQTSFEPAPNQLA